VSIEFRLPELGENVASGDVVRVLVVPGDTVAAEQPVLELETDKATVEVPSSVTGTVVEVKVQAGQKVKVGQLVLVVDGPGAGLHDPASAEGTASRRDDTTDNDAEAGADVGSIAAGPLAPVSEAAEVIGTAPPGAPVAADAGPSIVEFILPELGENVAGGDVVHVLVKVGERIAREQPVLELETDKATLEVPSSVAGIVKAIRVTPGTMVKVGEPVLVVETLGPGVAAAAPVTVQQVRAAAPPPAVAAPAPDKPGMLEDALAEAQAEQQARTTRGAVVDIASARAGGPEPRAAAAPAPAAPSVRRMARELGVDIHQVPGSGPGRRISTDDVKAFVKKTLAGGGSRPADVSQAPALAPPALPDFAKWGPIERQPMRAVRRTTAERLSTAWSQVPHVTQFDEADVTALEDLRKQFGNRVEAAGGRLTVTSISLKVVAAALRAFPRFNTAVDMTAGETVQKGYCHIGVAVDTPRGLLVPVIRDADRKGIVELSVELAQLSERARAGKLTLDEMQGGCFTITNLGGIGGTHFTPIVNHPEVAILGLSRARLAPVWKDGAFVPRLMLPLSLSYDHRVIDGADGIRFLRWVVEALEQPFLLSLHG
jgi:pyruvate dehydrogenase E2 component (dihydrolipoamide acetyltransferase)